MVTINCKSERLITEIPHSLNKESRYVNTIGQTIKSPFIKPGKFLTNAELQGADFHLKITDFENIAGKKRIIGRGSFGEVYLMKHRLLQKEYAVKVINKEVVIGTPAYNSIKEEANIHKRLIHDNIIRMYSNLEDERKLYLVLEYATQGNLFYYIQKHNRISEKDAFYFFMQACSGLYFLHCNNYIHRDIKPENLLLNKDGVLKICDFGWCTQMNGIKKPCSGTLEYMAPELLRNRDYDYTVDLWSMGVLLYEMLHGSSPFKGKTDADTMGNILQCNIVFRDGISEEAKSIIRALLQKTSQQRIKWKDVFGHKWVQKYETQFENHRFPFNENDFQEFSIKDYVNPDCAIRLPYSNSFSTLTNVINKKKNSAKFTSNSTIFHATISPENKKLFVGFKSQSKLSVNNEKYKRSQFTNLTNGPVYQAKSLESSLCAMNTIRVHTPATAKQQSLWEKIKSFMFN